MPRHLQSLEEFNKLELLSFLHRAAELKNELKQGVLQRQLEGKTIGLVFEKPSTRTRVSFEAAMYGLGGQVIFLSARDTQLARSEPLKDMARVMARRRQISLSSSSSSSLCFKFKHTSILCDQHLLL